MENTFNFNRLMLLIRRQWIGLGKIYLMAWGVLVGLLLLLYAFFLRGVDPTSDPGRIVSFLQFRFPLFVFLGLFYITITSGSYFANLGQKAKATSELLLPASYLEKLLTALFYTVLIASVSYFLIFYLVDAGFISHLRSFTSVSTSLEIESGLVKETDLLVHFYKTDLPIEVYYFLFLPYLLSAIFLLGSIYFKSFQYIKTAISLFLYILIFLFFMYKANTWFIEGTISNNSSNPWGDRTNVFNVIRTSGILLTILFWSVSYLRLKEKEV